MRKQVFALSFILVLLISFSSFAYSYYTTNTSVIKEQTTCCKKPRTNSETIFESLVKNLVGAVKS